MIREETGEPQYDLTYAQLCSAGASLCHGIEVNDASVSAASARELLLGLVAWNRKARFPSGPNVPLIQIARGAQPNAARGLVAAVRWYECVRKGDNGGVVPIDEAVEVVGTPHGVVIASKLLHFLSPGYLPILDRKVYQYLRNPGDEPGPDDYRSYAAALRALGITGHGPDGPDHSVQAFGDSTVAPHRRLRRVDCTLWARAPRSDDSSES